MLDLRWPPKLDPTTSLKEWRAAAEQHRSCWSSREEASHIQGQEQQICFAGLPMKRYPTSRVGSSRSALLDWLWRDIPRPRSGAADLLCWTGYEEIPHVQGQEQQICFAGLAMKRYPTSKVRSSRCALLDWLWRDTPHPRSEKPQ